MIKKLASIVIMVTVIVATIGIPPKAGLVNAQTSLEYYKGLFNSWGIPVDTLPQKNIKLDTPATKKDLQLLQLELEGTDTNQSEATDTNTNKEGRYLLLLTSQSQIKPQDSFGWLDVIVVCDSVETTFLPQGVSCALNSLNLADQNPNESSVSDKILQTIQPVNVNGVNYYLLPQVLLVTPQYQKNLGDYFKALSRAQASTNMLDKEKTAESMSRDLLKTFKDSSIFESTLYALVLLLFVVALRKPILTVVNNPRRLLEKNLYINQTRRAIDLLTKNSGIVSFIFLILIIFYIPIFYALTIKAQLLGDPAYPIKYLTTTLNPLNIPNYLTAQNLFRIGLLFYHYILALFGLFLLIPNLAKVIIRSTQKLRATKFRVTFPKWLIPATIALNGLLLAFVDLKSLTGFLALSVIILLISLFYLKSQSVEYPNLFTTKQRRLVFLTMFSILALNIFYPLWQKGQPIKYAYESLIGIKDTVIALPYSKKWGKNVLFESYYYNGDSNVYADGYLIYSPNAERIVNKPLNKFNDAENFIIVSEKPNKVSETLLKNPILLNYLSTADFSPLFTAEIKSTDVYNSPALKAQITFNCNFAPSPTVVKLETLTLNKFSRDDDVDPVSTESIEIMNFPGCKTETGTETFEAPLDPYIIPQDFAILRIRGIDAKHLAGLKIFAGGKESPVKFINREVLNESQYKILYSSPNQIKEITNYSTEVKKEFLVNIKTDDQGFDLSVPINKLMKAGVLQNPFIIWTNKPNEIIQKL